MRGDTPRKSALLTDEHPIRMCLPFRAREGLKCERGNVCSVPPFVYQAS